MSDMVESQDELFLILQACFINDKELIDKERFLKIVKEISSEIFLFVST